MRTESAEADAEHGHDHARLDNRLHLQPAAGNKQTSKQANPQAREQLRAQGAQTASSARSPATRASQEWSNCSNNEHESSREQVMRT